MNIWFWRLAYSPHHFRIQILSIVMLQASIYDSGREGEVGIAIVFYIGVYYQALKF